MLAAFYQASRNVAGQFGGGVLVSAYGRVEWIRGAMSSNNAGASGGGVACMAVLKLSGASLTQNQAVDGGAVYFGQVRPHHRRHQRRTTVAPVPTHTRPTHGALVVWVCRRRLSVRRRA